MDPYPNTITWHCLTTTRQKHAPNRLAVFLTAKCHAPSGTYVCGLSLGRASLPLGATPINQVSTCLGTTTHFLTHPSISTI